MAEFNHISGLTHSPLKIERPHTLRGRNLVQILALAL